MVVYKGILNKMETTIDNVNTIVYKIPGMSVPMNSLLEQHITIDYNGEECISCHKNKKLYRQGYCYNCFIIAPETGNWIMRPELSQAHLGIEEKNLDYEREVQLQEHIVYLAKSSGIKVGVTRKTQIPTRWIDQGAIQATELLEVPNRYLAGIAEVKLKQYISDKTNWRKMLTNKIVDERINDHIERLDPYIPDELKKYRVNKEIKSFHYPVKDYPEKVSSLNIAKNITFSGKLIGIKGQYLIFNDGNVFNVRTNTGKLVIIHDD